MSFRDEGNFSSPASPERRGGGTGAGRYARHQAAKENMKKTKQILWVTVYKTILLHCLPNIIVEAIGRTKVERRMRSSEGVAIE